MFNRRIRTALTTLALMLSTSAAAPLVADDNVAPVAPTVAPAPAAAGMLNGQRLGELLTNLGFEFTTAGAGDNAFYYFTVKRDTWDIKMEVALSPDHRTLWLGCVLNNKDRMKDMPAEFFNRLLKQNYDIFPCAYQMSDKGVLYMFLPLENKDLKPAMVRKQIDVLADQVRNSVDTWYPQRAAAKIAEEAKAREAAAAAAAPGSNGKAQVRN